MHLDALTPVLVAIALAVVVIGWILRRLHQPSVVAYLIAGVVLGPFGLGLIENQDAIAQFGSIGVVLLLFFTGMEVSPRHWADIWKVIVIGTLLQIFLTLALVWLLGQVFDWAIERILLISFVLTISSTAVVIKLLQEWNELASPMGQRLLGILLVQDLAIVPMMIILGRFGEQTDSTAVYTAQIVCGIFITALAVWVTVKETIHLRFLQEFKKDQEMQLFTALLICFSLALLTGISHLSTALGAFVAGLVVGSAKETGWVQHNLESLKVLLIAFFFLSIGMLMDLQFLLENLPAISGLVLIAVVMNTLINLIILRSFRTSWRDSLYGSAVLSQTGEFGFVLASIALTAGIISDFSYQMTISTIALSLAISPLYIGTIRLWTHRVQLRA
ncbi:cation:proton antiporter domain-containing protein [Spongorhabdus nitratireducens]